MRAVDRLAIASYPEECCGVLLGRMAAVEAIWPTANAHPGPRSKRYEIDVRELYEVHRAAREKGLEVVGYYHSHPDAPARPSARDRETALPGVSYLILAVTAGRIVDRRAWRFLGEDSPFGEEVPPVRCQR